MSYSRKKIAIDKEWLREQYTTLCRDKKDIAKDLGCSIPTIDKWLVRWGIKRIRRIAKPAWNKGLTKETNEKLRRLSESRMGEGNPMFGKDAWNKGLSKETNEKLAHVSELMHARVLSEETRQRMREAKLGLAGEETNNWKGGNSYTNHAGYEVNYKGYKHRQIAEECLGKKLHTKDVVHHLDGDKTHNSPENLIVLSPSSHSKLHNWMRDRLHVAPFQKLWLLANHRNYLTLEGKYEDQDT